MYLILLFVGIFMIVYFLCIAFLVGHGNNFYFIWLLLGSSALLLSFLMKKGIWRSCIPAGLRKGFWILAGLGGLVFLIVEGCIVSGFGQEGREGLDYLVVLGAQMKTSGPSKALQYRLDEAYSYLMKNQNTRVIVSGGQGANEPVSEARGMYDYLVAKGISADRIRLEDKSTNTFENLTFSGELLDRKENSVGIVSNNFHVFRAVKIARKAGYENVCGIAAKGEPFLQCNNMMREFLGVMKDFLVGNM